MSTPQHKFLVAPLGKRCFDWCRIEARYPVADSFDMGWDDR